MRNIMATSEGEQSFIRSLEGHQLSAVIFVMDYLQLQFDDLLLNSYIWPQVKIKDAMLTFSMPGYRDALCERIRRNVVQALEYENDRIEIRFDDEGSFIISLEEEDRTSPEVAMLQDQKNNRWVVW